MFHKEFFKQAKLNPKPNLLKGCLWISNCGNQKSSNTQVPLSGQIDRRISSEAQNRKDPTFIGRHYYNLRQDISLATRVISSL